MNLRIRPATPADADACGQICYDAFYTIARTHAFTPDFPSVEAAQMLMRMAIDHPDAYAIVAEMDERIVGSNFLWEQCEIGGVGPITIDPGVQNAGLGRRLMDAALNRAEQSGRNGVRLVQAGYHTRSLSLYAKLGFDPREPLANMQGKPIGKSLPGYKVRPAESADQSACDALCRTVHGHDRHGELSDAIRHKTASVVEREGRITGYATLLGFFGHAAAETTQDLKALIAAATEFAGPGILVPARNAELLRWCLDEGLQIVQPMTLMSRGFYQEPQGAFLPSVLF